MISNDCGGIVTNYASTGTSITGNVIDTITGNLVGVPTPAISQTAGIYLDDLSNDVQVRGNTVTGADYGVHMHDAYNLTVSGNLLFGNRRYQLWMQEETAKLRSNGDIYGNRVESNLMAPTTGGPSVFLESYVGDTADFATFSNNHYSALISLRPVGERSATSSNSYAFSEWQAAGQDISGRVTQPAGYASFLSKGINIVPNGNLANNISGWSWWNSTAPYAQSVLLSCSFGPCLQLTAGATPTILSSPNFSVTAGQWYRVSFDAATSQTGQGITVVVRRGGGGSAGYENLMATPESFSGSTTWRRYSFIFQSIKTVIANDPATAELGARVDFENIQPGSSLTVATLEIVPLTRSQAAVQLRLQSNPSGSSTSIPCSPDDEAGNLCNKFVNMTDDSPLDWSGLIPPYSGNASYTRDMALVDTDNDSVADVEDRCPKTPAGTAVNARGCGYFE
jgi:parallel beta-helix repeat protein